MPNQIKNKLKEEALYNKRLIVVNLVDLEKESGQTDYCILMLKQNSQELTFPMEYNSEGSESLYHTLSSIEDLYRYSIKLINRYSSSYINKVDTDRLIANSNIHLLESNKINFVFINNGKIHKKISEYKALISTYNNVGSLNSNSNFNSNSNSNEYEFCSKPNNVEEMFIKLNDIQFNEKDKKYFTNRPDGIYTFNSSAELVIKKLQQDPQLTKFNSLSTIQKIINSKVHRSNSDLYKTNNKDDVVKYSI